MGSPLPCTPIKHGILPYNASPSDNPFEPYLHYVYQPCPSPTPSSSRVIPCAISPHQYQLAHLDLGLFRPQSTPSAPISSPTDSLSAHFPLKQGDGAQTTRQNLRFDASNASGSGLQPFRSFGTTSQPSSRQRSPSRAPSSHFKFLATAPSPPTGSVKGSDNPGYDPWQGWFRSSSPVTADSEIDLRANRETASQPSPFKRGLLGLDAFDEQLFSSSQGSSCSVASRGPSSSISARIGALSPPSTPSSQRSNIGRTRFKSHDENTFLSGHEHRVSTGLNSSPSKSFTYPTSPSLASLLHYDYPFKTPRSDRFSNMFCTMSPDDEYSKPGTPFRSAGASNRTDDLCAGLDVSPILRQDGHANETTSRRQKWGERTTERLERATPTGRLTLRRSLRENDAQSSEGRLYASPTLQQRSQFSLANVFNRSYATADDHEDAELPLAALRLSPQRSAAPPVPGRGSRLVSAPPVRPSLQGTRSHSDLLNARFEDHSPGKGASTRFVKGSFTSKATTDSLDWDMDSPLSSPPASFPSSPRDAAPATGVRVPRVQTDASGFNAPSGGDHLTQSGGMYRPTSDVEAMHDFSIERPTRSRIKALNAALLPQQEPVGSPAGSAVASSARGARGRKRKFASPSVVQEVRDCSERKSKRAKRIVTTDAPTLETGGMSAALEQEPSGKPQLDDTDTCVTSSSRQLGIRTFPPSIPVQHQFSQIYRRFPVLENNLSPAAVAGATPNPPRSVWDLYTPRWTKGRGTTKVGLCPICVEKPSRGGEGKKLWLSMKFSAYKCYHMQYAHGICPTTGLPFSPPTAFHYTNRLPQAKQGFKPKYEKTQVQEGKCHKCHKWVPVEGVKDVEVKVKEIFWWKHAASCHHGTNIIGEQDIFLDDDVYRAALAATEEEDI